LKTLKVGIATPAQMMARTMAIARGEIKPKAGDPKVWFTSVESFAKVLSARNCALLALIAQQKPASLTQLEALSGRKKSNLSRTLHKMELYGLVQLEKGAGGVVRPRARYEQVALDLNLMSA
jgi:predicted transcriptional regulator